LIDTLLSKGRLPASLLSEATIQDAANNAALPLTTIAGQKAKGIQHRSNGQNRRAFASLLALGDSMRVRSDDRDAGC
jgi:hypothetical protein